MAGRCDYCGRPLDRPGSSYCDSPHPRPDLAQTIVAAIEQNLNDRRLGWDGLDLEILDEVRDSLASLVRGLIGVTSEAARAAGEGS